TRARPSSQAERPVFPHLVVLLPLLGVLQDRVRLPDLLEALGRLLISGVRVRVVLLRELPIGLLDVVLGCLLVDTEHSIEVLVLAGHDRLSRPCGRSPAPDAPAAPSARSPSGTPGRPGRPGPPSPRGRA